MRHSHQCLEPPRHNSTEPSKTGIHCPQCRAGRRNPLWLGYGPRRLCSNARQMAISAANTQEVITTVKYVANSVVINEQGEPSTTEQRQQQPAAIGSTESPGAKDQQTSIVRVHLLRLSSSADFLTSIPIYFMG
ncbi:hypothetical protein ALQ79_200644 [Pseudomonas amygdali pv. lachrymans]|nr:hypothetical protein ALQ79_200644 [Pseudomonas amygdali pv. lachrymans]